MTSINRILSFSSTENSIRYGARAVNVLPAAVEVGRRYK